MKETSEDHKDILQDTQYWISLENKATSVVAKQILDDGSISMITSHTIMFDKIMALHTQMWDIYKLRGVMNVFIKRNKIIKQRMTALLRSNEGLDEKVLNDKATNDRDMKEQGEKIEKAINDMKDFKQKAIIEAYNVNEQNAMKRIRELIKKEYKKLCKEAMEKDEPIIEDPKSEEESITQEDMMMEDVDGWVDMEMSAPSNKKVKKY